MQKQKVYQVVSKEGTEYLNGEELLAKYKQIGTNNNPINYKSLLGEPKLEGFYGPIHKEEKEDVRIVLYESKEIPNSVTKYIKELVAEWGEK
jgi:hypothetical protein